jgi:hypothetical protein
VNVIESGSALADEAKAPSAKIEATTIVPTARIIDVPLRFPLAWFRYGVSSKKRYGEAA